MEFIHEIINQITSNNTPAALAMIINVEGSSYRKQGAWMLSRKERSPIGLLSGGCLEQDVAEHAKTIFSTQKMRKLEYDLSSEDDLGWGQGAGCNGKITVLLRDVDVALRKALAEAQLHLTNGKPVLYIQSLTHYDKFAFYHKEDDPSYYFATILAKSCAFSHKVGFLHKNDGCYYYQLIWPKPHLYIIGAGLDAKPLVQFASDTDYVVHMIDWRSTFCCNERFPEASFFIVGEPDELIETIPLSSFDSVIIMTHDFQRDRRVLQILQEKTLLYVGILGSRKRTERLLNSSIPNWLHSPIGLGIGAEGPKEIAISIMGELIAARRGKLT
ncbi:XdhC family protein [Bacillus niameyensis]|uniref:XdhC family protein n=1 Tax=Bacillus niameyensis TaxID=1522308 RepID=UPI000784FEA5|nr:XdhC family protein [Bacillus niameyensis]